MTSPGALVLVIEDEPGVRRFLRVSLVNAGYRVLESDRGREALEKAATALPDLVILDLGLPDIDGMEVLRELRSWTAIPVLILTARETEKDKVAALDGGADDYLTKPFSAPELLARVRVALRHASLVAGPGEPVIQSGDLRVDLAKRQVFAGERAGGREVHLTPTEFKLLALLAQNAGKVLTHRQLLQAVWGPDYGYEAHYLRVFMAQLRRKIEDDPANPKHLKTEPGVGYRFAVD